MRAVIAIVALALVGAAVWFFVLGGGSNLVAEAAAEREAACAAETRDVARQHTVWFNQVSAVRSDERDALSTEDRTTYDAHRVAAFDCLNALPEG
ncbi:hypothetical protein [Gymnodinialimonas sp. 57CJ19]|uniref:hypothetical protein n=1 Tax=Gymnodinialimonas sp. 57CJ19 TaxID=3138498 RepID=UPI0031343DC9